MQEPSLASLSLSSKCAKGLEADIRPQSLSAIQLQSLPPPPPAKVEQYARPPSSVASASKHRRRESRDAATGAAVRLELQKGVHTASSVVPREDNSSVHDR